MKLLHTQVARSIWLFDIRDLNPKGKDVLGDLVGWVKDSYNFAESPDPDNPVPNTSPASPSGNTQTAPAQAAGGFVFKRGNFQVKEEIFVEIGSLTVFNDGIVVDTMSSTDDADAFADELLTSIAKEFKLSYGSDTIRRKIYLSELIVKSEMKLGSVNPALAAFAAKLPSSSAGGHSLPLSLESIAFWSEPNDAGQHRAFKIERQLGRAFSEGRFYSQALLQTTPHYQLLEEFEKIVMP